MLGRKPISVKRLFHGLVAVAALVAAGAPTRGSEMLDVQASPQVSYAPGHVRVRISVEPNADNRKLVVEADSGAFYRSSEMSLDGAQAARTHWIEWKQLPAGDYTIVATLSGVNGERSSVRDDIKVFDAGEPIP